ncbi:ABC transporter permease subunit [Telmatospirillum sp.]|uniref:ABC transporter permease n=1 Tax=Telmatospirillum sp. TaxID=2079197 RepID=UPI00284E16A8|nr:ABC transporter permease subunit [Telmatospirillum sp.]MDR3439662.1 ABC transporter permease subunit [Telmatospirillum sp.]
MRQNLLFWLLLAFTVATCAFLIVPIGLSLLAGVSANWQLGPSGGLTLRWIEEVWSLYSGTVVRSLVLAVACLIADLLLGVPLAYVLARHPSRRARAIEELIMLPVAVPGLATALALIILYGGWHQFRGSSSFILVGHVLFTLPFMVRSVLAVLASIDVKTLEEGAASLGAGPWRRLATVVLPNAKPGILAGSLMVVTLSVGEFNMTWMLHTPLTQTLPVGLADAYASMRLEIASAYTVVFLLMIVPLLILMQLAAPSAVSGTAARGGK